MIVISRSYFCIVSQILPTCSKTNFLPDAVFSVGAIITHTHTHTHTSFWKHLRNEFCSWKCFKLAEKLFYRNNCEPNREYIVSIQYMSSLVIWLRSHRLLGCIGRRLSCFRTRKWLNEWKLVVLYKESWCKESWFHNWRFSSIANFFQTRDNITNIRIAFSAGSAHVLHYMSVLDFHCSKLVDLNLRTILRLIVSTLNVVVVIVVEALQ